LPAPDPNDCTARIPTRTNIASYTYMIRDSSKATAPATHQVDILDVNVPPTAQWPAAVTNVQDAKLESVTNSPMVIHLDDRDGDRIFFTVTRLPEHGRLYFQNRDEEWEYVTSTNFQVLDYFFPGDDLNLFFVLDSGFNTEACQPDCFASRV